MTTRDPGPGPDPSNDGDTMDTPTDELPVQPETTETTGTPLRRGPRVHPFNTVFGLIFLAVAGSWAARERDLLEGHEVGRYVAIALIVLGSLGVLATLVVSRRSRP